MKETIVYIGVNVPDKSPAGVRVFSNVMALKNYGFDVKIISVDDAFQKDHDFIEGIEIWHLKRPNSSKEWFVELTSAKKYIEIIEKINSVKAVIAFELRSISYLKLRRYCRKKNIKTVCETGEWQKWENLGYLKPLGRAIRVLDINSSMYYAYKKADALIVTSSYFREHFKGCCPTIVIPTLQWHRIELSSVPIVNTVRKFIYAGGLGFRKDLLNDIIHAFGKLLDKDFEFNILGLSQEQYLERYPEDEALLKQINKAQLKIKFWGRVAHSEVLKAIKESDFAVIIRESIRRNNVGFPTKFGESINCGTPVIVTDFSDVVYYTEKNKVGIVTDVNSVEKGIAEALNMSDEDVKVLKTNCRKCDAFYYKGHSKELGEFIDRIIVY